jgi:hypothetical protein
MAAGAFFRRPMQNDPQRFVNNSQCGSDSRTIPPSIKPFLDLPNRHREDHFLLCVRAHPITLHRPCRGKSAHEGESRHLGDSQSKRSRSRNSQRITKGEISTLGQIERAFSISEML